MKKRRLLVSLFVLIAGVLSACTLTRDIDPDEGAPHSEVAEAVTTQLSQPLQPAVYMAPPIYNGSYSGKSGDYINYPNPYWHLAQWGIPVALTPTYGPSSGWMTANSYARLQYYASETNGTNVYELAQNGNTPDLPCGNEFDLFLEPGDPNNYTGSPDGFATSAPLSNLSAATLNVGMKIVFEQFNGRCGLNYVGYTSALTLGNPTAGQIIFYQINLRDSRGSFPNMAWCPSYETTNNGNFCLDDDIRVLNGSTVPANNTRVNNTINILSRLKQIIATNHAKANFPNQKLDPDPSHWMIGGLYFGQILQGGMIPTSRWYDYSFVVQ